ncbi:EamA family transporter RarD [Actinokineospora guangxiensis]|uniref:EamA family transporter RarD n=1 Tax=Actinokineospora guangxiensis TaxID=1490288 RepID=A0ABW0EXX8_9PSEU
MTVTSPSTRGLTPVAPGISASGVLSSVGASVLFGLIFFLAAALDPLDAVQIFSWRVVALVIVLALVFSALRLWSDVRGVLTRLRRRPALVGVVLVNSAMLAVQQWLFGWAPQAGRGLEVALGYLLLPLAMVVLGVFLYRERLTPLLVASVSTAAVGVAAAVFVAGGLAWPTLLVALGFPLYFAVRRSARLDGEGALLVELLAMLPFAVWTLHRKQAWDPLVARPGLVWPLVLFGVVSGIALILYFRAARLLPFGLFGLLSYLEPVLLVIVAVTLLGETLTPVDAVVYGPIVLALALLALASRRARAGAGDGRSP